MHLHPDDDPVLARARKRVAMKLGFYIHLAVFVLVNSGLLLLAGWMGGNGSAAAAGNAAAAATTASLPRWTHFPIWGWGLGLCMHGLFTFIALQGEGFKERMIQREAQRLRGQQQAPQPPQPPGTTPR